MARKKKHEEHVNHERWLVSYADFITLLFATFTALFAISNADKAKLELMAKSINQAFSGKPSIVPTITLDPNAKGNGALLVQIVDAQAAKPAKEQGDGGPKRGNGDEADPVAATIEAAKNGGQQVASAQPSPGPTPDAGETPSPAPAGQATQAMLLIPSASPTPVPAETPPPNPSAQLGTPDGKANDALARQVSQLMSQIGMDGKVNVHQEPRGTVVSLGESAFFAPGGVDVAPQSVHTLDTVLNALRGKDYEIRVEGHTDNTPVAPGRPYRTNEELSAMRASRIMEFMIEDYGYPGDKVSAAGFGSFRPVASNDTEAGRLKNRRVDIVILNRGELAKDPH